MRRDSDNNVKLFIMDKYLLRLLQPLTVISLVLPLLACFGGGSGPEPVQGNPPPPETGRLVNSPVDGVDYETPSRSGITNGQGEFQYLPSESVTFSIGGIQLGSAPGAPIITPVELTGSSDDDGPTDQAATNLLVFLQSIDVDGDHSNGISVSDDTRAAAAGLSLDFSSPAFSTDVVTVIENIAPGNAVVSTQTALDNFYQTYVFYEGSNTFSWSFPGYPEFPPPTSVPPRDTLTDAGFEPPGVPDAVSGNVGNCGGNSLGAWNTFNCNFVTSALGPSSAPVSHDADGTQSLIQFGVDGGAENVIEALEGDMVELTAHAMSWEPDPFNNLAIVQLTFWDAPGGRLGGGNQVGAAIETFADSLGNQPYQLLPQDGAEVTDWTEISLSATAPTGTQSAQVLMLHVLIDGTPETGALYWDDIILTSTPTEDSPPPEPEPELEFSLIWSDEFDVDGPPSPGNWGYDLGYGDGGWGNNEWQLYTDDPENVRVENGNLVISALCVSSDPGPGADGETYSQDFEALGATDPEALNQDGYVIFADVWDGDVGTGIFKYPYGPFPAPNGGPGFSAIATGEGGPDQGEQHLNIYSDYNNGDQTSGGNCGASGCTINTSVFQEITITADDIGTTYTLSFDAKSPFEGGIADAVQPVTEASAFIKTLDPGAGFATTNDIRADMTAISNVDWNSFSISLDLSDPLLEGQLLQFGFNTVTTEYDNTGVYYDNIVFTNVDAPPEECVAGVRDGTVTSARINTLETFNTIRYGKIEARIKPPVGKGAWPAFWMLGSNFPEVGWPRSGEIDIMEMWNTFGSNPMTTHSTLHWCDETIQFPEACSFPEGRVFVGDSLVFEESLGDDFHIFEAVWDPERIVFYADGRQVFSRVIDPDTMEEFTRDFFMILNVAMGGTLGSADQPPDGTETWPQTMLVDYVKVYEAVP